MVSSLRKGIRRLMMLKLFRTLRYHPPSTRESVDGRGQVTHPFMSPWNASQSQGCEHDKATSTTVNDIPLLP